MRLSRLVRFAPSLLVALALVAPAADAGQRRTRAHKGVPTSGHIERTVTRTGKDGTSRTSQHDTTWQRGGGQWSRDTVHTGPNGKQGTTHVEGAKTENGYTKTTTRTRPDGSTSTKQVTRTVTPVTPESPPAE
ncbi:MAG TPA: hypothetical protein VNF72_17175 [Myxococcota bacterium]|nr:hypothetical protein [Myxococcota bacterium]